MAGEIEFDWDDANRQHLAAHKVAPTEFEQVMCSDPLDLHYEVIGGEERYRAVGLTDGGRLLAVLWTPRNGKIRAVTAFPDGVADTKAFLENRR